LEAGVDVVTGAFGYTGRFIARRLLDAGHEVRTLTGHPGRGDPFAGKVNVARYAFDDPKAMVTALRGCDVLYNTYWVRFPWRGMSFDGAVANTRALIRAAGEAGVRRVAHISITNPSAGSPLEYFRGKALVEEAVVGSSLSYAIIRPSVLFGGDDVLVNNIAWLTRRFPFFAVAGTGQYQVRPVHVDDVAQIAVDAGATGDDLVIDAVGPETFTFDELVRVVAAAVGHPVRIVHVRPGIVVGVAKVLGLVVRDVMLTSDELRGLMAGLVATGGPATGATKLSQWVADHATDVGRVYASELTRHYR
jgi:NADH dehydrogenase